MSTLRLIIFIMVTVFASGCTSPGKEPFQIYSHRLDCVSCNQPEDWGFKKRKIYRNEKIVFFASYYPRNIGSRELEHIGLCYGMAIDTIRSGATHFRILDKEQWGDWQVAPTPATISGPDILGRVNIYGGGMERINRDKIGMWWTNHYYEIGSPPCEISKNCSIEHKFNIEDCPYEGEKLRIMTEEKIGSLACVMKRNPKLLLHTVYSSVASCGYPMDVRLPTNIGADVYRSLEIGYWIPAADIIKKFEPIFEEVQ